MSSEEKGGIRLDAWWSEKARRGELDPQRKGKHIASRKSSTAFSTYSILRNLWPQIWIGEWHHSHALPKDGGEQCIASEAWVGSAPASRVTLSNDAEPTTSKPASFIKCPSSHRHSTNFFNRTYLTSRKQWALLSISKWRRKHEPAIVADASTTARQRW